MRKSLPRKEKLEVWSIFRNKDRRDLQRKNSFGHRNQKLLANKISKEGSMFIPSYTKMFVKTFELKAKSSKSFRKAQH